MTPTSTGSRPPSPWWWLLALPAFPLIGWALGNLPAPAPKPKVEPPRRVTPASAPAPSPIVAPGPAEPAADPVEVLSSWSNLGQAISESRDNGKPILIDFNADWCPPCQRMKHQLFEDDDLGRAVRLAVIPVSIVDRRREQGRNPSEVEDLQRQYEVDAFPTLIVYSPATGRRARAQGFGDPSETLRWIEQAAAYVR